MVASAREEFRFASGALVKVWGLEGRQTNVDSQGNMTLVQMKVNASRVREHNGARRNVSLVSLSFYQRINAKYSAASLDPCSFQGSNNQNRLNANCFSQSCIIFMRPRKSHCQPIYFQLISSL